MRNTLLKYKVVLVFCLIAQLVHAQKTIATANTFPNNNSSLRAYYHVSFFLTLSKYDEARIETGAINEHIDQIKFVRNKKTCANLNQLMLNSPKLTGLDSSHSVGWTKYYLSTDNFYYIFWERDSKHISFPYLLPTKLFLVVSNDLDKVWEFYNEERKKIKLDRTRSCSKSISISGQPTFIVIAGNKELRIPEKENTKDSLITANLLDPISPDWVQSIDVFKGKDISERHDSLEEIVVVLIILKRGTYRKMPFHLRKRFKKK